MFSPQTLGSMIKALEYGVIGLGFLLALMSFYLLNKERNSPDPRGKILAAIFVFMVFSIVLCGIGLYAQLYPQTKKEQIILLSEQIEELRKEKVRLQEDNEKQKNALVQKWKSTNEDLENRLVQSNNTIIMLQEKINKFEKLTLKWDYDPAGDFFQCKVNGEKIGVRLNCNNFKSCGNWELNRAVCAYLNCADVWKEILE